VHLGVGAVVEDGDGAITVAPSVVLEGAVGTFTHLEVALLAAEAPQYLSALAHYLVDTPGIAGAHEQVAVGLYVYGVEVEVVVEMVGIFWELDVGLLDADVIEAVPLEDDLPALDVNLLVPIVRPYSIRVRPLRSGLLVLGGSKGAIGYLRTS
jgi:hypothetical protein